MSIELEKYTVDQLMRCTKDFTRLSIEATGLREKISQMQSGYLETADQIKKLTEARDDYMRQVTNLETSMRQQFERSRAAEKRLFELWEAADKMADQIKPTAGHQKDFREAHQRLRKALQATSDDCGQIPF